MSPTTELLPHSKVFVQSLPEHQHSGWLYRFIRWLPLANIRGDSHFDDPVMSVVNKWVKDQPDSLTLKADDGQDFSFSHRVLDKKQGLHEIILYSQGNYSGFIHFGIRQWTDGRWFIYLDHKEGDLSGLAMEVDSKTIAEYRGVGQTLVGLVERFALIHGIRMIYLDGVTLRPANSFFEKLGYQLEGLHGNDHTSRIKHLSFENLTPIGIRSRPSAPIVGSQLIKGDVIRIHANDGTPFEFRFQIVESQEKKYEIAVFSGDKKVGYVHFRFEQGADGDQIIKINFSFRGFNSTATKYLSPYALLVDGNWTQSISGKYKGIGRSLMGLVESIGQSKGVKKIVVEDVSPNVYDKFYCGLGYKKVEERSRENVLYLEKDLTVVTSNLPQIAIKYVPRPAIRFADLQTVYLSRYLLSVLMIGLALLLMGAAIGNVEIQNGGMVFFSAVFSIEALFISIGVVIRQILPRLENRIGSKEATGPPILLYGRLARSAQVDFIEYDEKAKEFQVNPALYALLSHRLFLVRFLAHTVLTIQFVPLHEWLHSRGWGERVAYGSQAIGVAISVVGFNLNPFITGGMLSILVFGFALYFSSNTEVNTQRIRRLLRNQRLLKDLDGFVYFRKMFGSEIKINPTGSISQFLRRYSAYKMGSRSAKSEIVDSLVKKIKSRVFRDREYKAEEWVVVTAPRRMLSNASTHMARAVSEALGIPFVDIQYDRPSVGGAPYAQRPTFKERIDIMSTLFSDLHISQALAGKKVLVVDDMVNTGSTVIALSRKLKESFGAKSMQLVAYFDLYTDQPDQEFFIDTFLTQEGNFNRINQIFEDPQNDIPLTYVFKTCADQDMFQKLLGGLSIEALIRTVAAGRAFLKADQGVTDTHRAIIQQMETELKNRNADPYLSLINKWISGINDPISVVANDGQTYVFRHEVIHSQRNEHRITVYLGEKEVGYFDFSLRRDKQGNVKAVSRVVHQAWRSQNVYQLFEPALYVREKFQFGNEKGVKGLGRSLVGLGERFAYLSGAKSFRGEAVHKSTFQQFHKKIGYRLAKPQGKWWPTVTIEKELSPNTFATVQIESVEQVQVIKDDLESWDSGDNTSVITVSVDNGVPFEFRHFSVGWTGRKYVIAAYFNGEKVGFIHFRLERGDIAVARKSFWFHRILGPEKLQAALATQPISTIDHRRYDGVGESLLALAERWAYRQGKKRFVVQQVDEDRAGYYQKRGYRLTDSKKYGPDGRELEKDLSPETFSKLGINLVPSALLQNENLPESLRSGGLRWSRSEINTNTLWAILTSSWLVGTVLTGLVAIILHTYTGNYAVQIISMIVILVSFTIPVFFASMFIMIQYGLPLAVRFFGEGDATGPPVALFGKTALANSDTNFIQYDNNSNSFQINPHLYTLLTYWSFPLRFLTHFFLNLSFIPIHERIHVWGRGEWAAYLSQILPELILVQVAWFVSPFLSIGIWIAISAIPALWSARKNAGVAYQRTIPEIPSESTWDNNLLRSVQKWVEGEEGALVVRAPDGEQFLFVYQKVGWFNRKHEISIIWKGQKIGYIHFKKEWPRAMVIQKRFLFHNAIEGNPRRMRAALRTLKKENTDGRPYKGLGTSLMGLAERFAYLSGHKKFYAREVANKNVGFYHGLGYRKTSARIYAEGFFEMDKKLSDTKLSPVRMYLGRPTEETVARRLAQTVSDLSDGNVSHMVETRSLGVGELNRGNNSEAGQWLSELNAQAQNPAFREELARALKGRAQGKFANDEELNRFVDLLLAVVVTKNSSPEKINSLLMFRGGAEAQELQNRERAVFLQVLRAGEEGRVQFVVDEAAHASIERSLRFMSRFGLNVSCANVVVRNNLTAQSVVNVKALQKEFGNPTLIVVPDGMRPADAPSFVKTFEEWLAPLIRVDLTNLIQAVRAALMAA